MGNISNQSFLASLLANMDLYLDLYLPSVLLRYLDLDCTCHHFFPWYLYLDCTCHQFCRGTCTCTCHQIFCGTCTCTCHQISPQLNTCTCTCHRVLVPNLASEHVRVSDRWSLGRKFRPENLWCDLEIILSRLFCDLKKCLVLRPV